MKGQGQDRHGGGRKSRNMAVKGNGAGEQQDKDQKRKQERKQARGREKDRTCLHVLLFGLLLGKEGSLSILAGLAERLV